MKLIIGLGNPGKEYEKTRHNAGFLALDALAKKLDLTWSHDAKRNADITKGSIDGTRVILAKPTTFMNLSGDAVQALASYNKVKPDDILIVHDDMDFPPEKMAFKKGGGHSGHKGLASAIDRMGTNDLARLRIGIGHPTKQSTEDWVLGKISKETLKAVNRAPDAMRDWVTQGLVKTMNTWNSSTS